MDHPPPPRLVRPQGASHERCRAASRGAERAALLRDPHSAGEDLPRPHPQENQLRGTRQVPPGQFPPGPALPEASPALPRVPRPLLYGPLPQVSPPGGGPDVAFRFGAVLDGASTQDDVFRACGVRRLGELALRG